MYQELNSQCSAEDDEEGDGEVGGVDVAVGFAADAEAFEAAEPGVGAFDDPAVAGVGVSAASAAAPVGVSAAAAFADPGLDVAVAELLVEVVGVVAAVGPELGWLVVLGEELVDEREQLLALAVVAGADGDGERQPVRVDGEVVLAGGNAAVYRAGTGLVAPLFASMIDASTTSRDQSIRPSRSSSATNSFSACSHTPAPIHSCSLRRHVSPLGKPSSRGRSM
jgi:hypothetical protein